MADSLKPDKDWDEQRTPGWKHSLIDLATKLAIGWASPLILRSPCDRWLGTWSQSRQWLPYDKLIQNSYEKTNKKMYYA